MAKNAPDVFAGMAVALARAALGDKEGMHAALTENVRTAARADLQDSSWVAEAYALAGESDLAIEWLEHSVARGYSAWEYLANYDRLLGNLRSDARFAAILERARVEWEA